MQIFLEVHVICPYMIYSIQLCFIAGQDERQSKKENKRQRAKQMGNQTANQKTSLQIVKQHKSQKKPK